MFHLNSFVNEIKDIGRQIAEEIGDKFDESGLLIETNELQQIRLVYFGDYISVELPIELYDDVVKYNIRRDGILSFN